MGNATLDGLLSAGWHVKALARSEESAGSLPDEVEVIRGHLEDASALDRLVGGADTVFHIGGVNTMCVADRQAMWTINVDAPSAVFEAAGHAGVRRMVHISSAATVGHRTSFYAETKWAADQRLRELAPSHDIELALVAPSSVQGPGRVTGTGKLILDVVAGRVKVMIDTAISIVDIDDCATAIRLAADADEIDDLLIVSGFTVSTREALELLESITGQSMGLRFVPALAVRALAALGPLLGPIGRIAGVELCPEMIRTMSVDHIHDGTEAARKLGMTYRSPSDTFLRLINWAETEGLR